MVSFNKQLRLLAGLGVFGLAVISAMPASAAVTSCADTNSIKLQPSQDITLRPDTSGAYVGSATVTAYCGTTTPGNELAGLTVNVSADRASTAPSDLMVSLNGGAAVNLTVAPTETLLATETTDSAGNLVLNISASSVSTPDLAAVSQPIGFHFEMGVSAPGGAPEYLPLGGRIFAATPELDSIALFGTGAMGMAGYAIMRLRAARARREDS